MELNATKTFHYRFGTLDYFNMIAVFFILATTISNKRIGGILILLVAIPLIYRYIMNLSGTLRISPDFIEFKSTLIPSTQWRIKPEDITYAWWRQDCWKDTLVFELNEKTKYQKIELKR